MYEVLPPTDSHRLVVFAMLAIVGFAMFAWEVRFFPRAWFFTIGGIVILFLFEIEFGQEMRWTYHQQFWVTAVLLLIVSVAMIGFALYNLHHDGGGEMP